MSSINSFNKHIQDMKEQDEVKLRDTAYEKPTTKFPIPLVGISPIKIPLIYKFKGKSKLVYPEFGLFVDLPATMRGINASRTYESIYEIMNKFSHTETLIEDVALHLSKALLDTHEYSVTSFVSFAMEINLYRKNPFFGLKTELTYPISGFCETKKNGKKIDYKRSLKITAQGITACPCAQQVIRNHYLNELKLTLPKQYVNIIKNYINLTHVQRACADLELITSSSFPDFYFFIDILESSFSAPIQHLLKRNDEAELIIKAANNPKFVEDVFREIILKFWLAYRSKLKNDDVVSVQVRSLESIHPHDMIVRGNFKGKELRRLFHRYTQ